VSETAPQAATMGCIAEGVHLFPIRVYYEDTDAAGIVYYANYLKFAERARTEMMRCLGLDHARLRREDGLVLAVRRCEIDYLLPAKLDDALVVGTRPLAAAGAALDLAQEITRGDAVLARLRLRIACLNAAGRPRRLPPALSSASLQSFQNAQAMVSEHAR
jgi:acyl-CoA thioester hydrolase